MSAQPQTYYTPEQYLEIERNATYKSEYYRGEIFAMAGATTRHNVVKDNLVFNIKLNLRGKPCRTMSSDQRILTRHTDGLYSYPDIVVVCGKPQFSDLYKDTVMNPLIIVEVLSKSTEGYDRGDKFLFYRQLESLREFVLIDSKKIHAEVYRKNEAGIWFLASEAIDIQGNIYLESVDITLPMEDVYLNTDDLPLD
ncbi:Uma2 family endonuclease [Runella sp.]|uniref:Uma2 family endonuclease n=1 Tax=Runella sp. TaxID=1960881 RepID=UPI003D142A81